MLETACFAGVDRTNKTGIVSECHYYYYCNKDQSVLLG